ncbi:unnamed protein product, partial [Nesidiocoris tenuis]
MLIFSTKLFFFLNFKKSEFTYACKKNTECRELYAGRIFAPHRQVSNLRGGGLDKSQPAFGCRTCPSGSASVGRVADGYQTLAPTPAKPPRGEHFLRNSRPSRESASPTAGDRRRNADAVNGGKAEFPTQKFRVPQLPFS